MNLQKLMRGAKDYRFLIDRGYNPRSAIRFVENRYLLSKLERDIIYRGVHTKAHDELVKLKLKEGLRRFRDARPCVAIDFINVVTTVIEAIAKGVISIGSDGLIRDHAKVQGKSAKNIEDVIDACNLLGKNLPSGRVLLVVEKNYPFSGIKARECIRTLGADASYYLAEKADTYIIDFSLKENCIVATSDSVVIEKSPLVIDLPFLTVQNYLSSNPNVIDLEEILYGIDYQFY